MRQRPFTNLRIVLGITGLLLALPLSAVGQQVRGKVVDRASRQPIPGVQVVLRAEDGRVITTVLSDSAGAFMVRAVQGGRYGVSATHIAYATATAPIELGAQDIVEVELHMAVAATELPPLVVIGRSRGPDAYLERNGFYARQKAGFGLFMTREQIERRRAYQTSDLFQGQSGVRVVLPNSDLRGKDVRMVRGEDPNCVPRVVMDNVIVRKGGRESNLRDVQTLDQLVQPEHVQAIEVYRGGSEVPQEYNSSNSACGVIVIWTRR